MDMSFIQEAFEIFLHDSYELNVRSIDKLAKQLHQRFGVSEKVASRFIMASTFRVAGRILSKLLTEDTIFLFGYGKTRLT